MSQWMHVPLRDVLRPRNEIVHPRDRPVGEGNFVGLEHIESGTGRRIGLLHVDLASLSGRKARFRNGDIVYGYLRPYLNKVWMAEFDGYCSVDQYVFTVSPTAVPEYVAFYLRSPEYLRQAPVSYSPGQLPRIRTEEVLAVPMPLPPLEHQRRIAAALTDQLHHAMTARASAMHRREVVLLARASSVERVFSSRRAREWPRLPFATLLASPLRTGISGPESADGLMLGLSLSAVRDGRLDPKPTKRILVDPTTNRLVREGGFYVVRGNGRLDLVGRGGLAPKPPAPVVFPDLLIEAIPDEKQLDASYLSFAWNSRDARLQLEQRARTSAGIHKINLANLASVLLPVPGLAEQRWIASQLRERLAAIDSMSRSSAAELEAIEALPAALLHRAFAEHGAA